MKTGTPEKIAQDRDERAAAADLHRHSSPEMVSLAQQLMQRTQFAADRIKEGNTLRQESADPEAYNWLIESARSLAGSVLSQADPTD